jgi:Restriction endonuclease
MSVRAKSSLVTRLKQLSPHEFENLAYDVVFLSGAQNLRWRTPSADGGRDLEAEFRIADFSGEHVTQRWYIECKRYNKSLNWPTVYEKLTVALNHSADYLLFITTSNFSVPCRDEVQRHNSKAGTVQIRVWPFYRLEHLLSIHGQVAIKYGLVQAPKALQVDFETIIFEITKLAQSTYGAAEFGQRTKDRIELLTAFTELLSARVGDVREFGHFVFHKFKPSRDSYEWCDPFPLVMSNFDQTSLRAALASIRAILGLPSLKCSVVQGAISVSVPSTTALRSARLFSLITTFGLIDVEFRDDAVILKARESNA